MSQSTHFMKLKQINIDIIKEALKRADFATKIDLSRTTGLSVATCNNILAELLLSGEVLEIEAGASTGGRPARRFVYNENFASVAAVFFRKEGDIEYMYCVVSNLLGQSIYEKTVEGLHLTLDIIKQTMDEMICKHANLKVLALGIPGVIHQGSVGYSNFEALAYLDLDGLEAYIIDKYDLLVVSENDQNCIATGYFNTRIQDKDESLAFLYYPKDRASGAGIILDGKILHGNSNFAGEISFLPLAVEISEQKRVQSDPKTFTEYVCKVIACINGILNPKTIVLSGYYFKAPLSGDIVSELKNWIPEKHLPQIHFESDIHTYYLSGLIHLALEQLKCQIEIVER